MVELKASNLSEEETCFELIEDAEYIDHCTFYIEVGAENKSNCKTLTNWLQTQLQELCIRMRL